MSKDPLQDSLDSIESTLSTLTQQLSSYTSLQLFINQIPNLLKFDSSLPLYKKKQEQLKSLLKSTKSQIFQQNLKKKSKTSQNPSNSDLSLQISLKNLEILFKQEACGAVQHLTSKFLIEEARVKSLLSSLKSDIKSFPDIGPMPDKEELLPRQEKLKDSFIESTILSVSERCSEIMSSKLDEFERDLQRRIEKIQAI